MWLGEVLFGRRLTGAIAMSWLSVVAREGSSEAMTHAWRLCGCMSSTVATTERPGRRGEGTGGREGGGDARGGRGEVGWNNAR